MATLLTAALLLAASPVRATTPEANALQATVTAIQVVSVQLQTGALDATGAADRLSALRDAVLPAEFSDECLPVALYIRVMADLFAGAMTAVSIESLPTVRGYVMLGASAWVGLSGQAVQDAMATCAGGL